MSIPTIAALPPLVTIERTAELLDCSPATVRRMISRGEINAVRLRARMVRVVTESIFDAARPIPTAAA